MPHYYKIANPRRKIETINDFANDLTSFLEQQNGKQNYRTAGVSEIEILYQRAGLLAKVEQVTPGGVLTSYFRGIEVVSQSELPLEFLCSWGEIVEEPRKVSKANHFFMVKSFMDGKPTFEQCCDIVRGIVGSYDLELNFSPLYSFPSKKSSFPDIWINVLTDGVFVGHTVGKIIEAVKFYEHFSTRFTKGMQYLPHKSHSLSFK